MTQLPDACDASNKDIDPDVLENNDNLIPPGTAPDDPVRMLLNDNIDHYPLLTANEEVELAKKIENGTDEEKKEAIDKLSNSNLRLVLFIAKDYVGRGIPFLELISNGYLGLMKAVEKFDYHRGCRFSTYATWWIKEPILKAFSQDHLIKKLNRTWFDFQKANNGEKPTSSQLAHLMGLSEQKVNELMRINPQPLSLDQTADNGEDESPFLTIPDSGPGPEEQVSEREAQRRYEESVRSLLTPLESKVWELRRPFDNARPHTLTEVGKEFGLTRDQARQIDAQIYQKLQNIRNPHST